MNKLKKRATVAAAAQSTPTKAPKAIPAAQAATIPRTKKGTATPVKKGKEKATEIVNEDESMAEASDAAMSSSKAHLNLASLTPNTN